MVLKIQKLNLNIDDKDKDGNSYLNMATQMCKFEAAKALIDAGADINS